MGSEIERWERPKFSLSMKKKNKTKMKIQLCFPLHVGNGYSCVIFVLQPT